MAAAEERIATARETEVANRRKAIDVLLAEKAAAERTIAAGAEKVRLTVEAEAQRLLNEAENVLTDPARASLFRRKLLEHVEGIVAASVKPLEKIKDIRIMQLDGMGGTGGEGRSGSPTDEVINSALRCRVQAPMIDSLLADIGIDGANLAKQGGLMREASDMQRIAGEARRSSGDDGKSASRSRAGAKSEGGSLNATRLCLLGDRCPGHQGLAEGARLHALPRWHRAYGKPVENGEPRTRSVAYVTSVCRTAITCAKSCSAFPTTTCFAHIRSSSCRCRSPTIWRRCG